MKENNSMAWAEAQAQGSQHPREDLAIALANQQVLSAEKGKVLIQLQDAKERIRKLEAQLTVPRRPLADFVALMECRLRDNDHKGEQGWRGDLPAELYQHLLKEVVELHAAILEGRGVPKEAADVANMAMMIADEWNDGTGFGRG